MGEKENTSKGSYRERLADGFEKSVLRGTITAKKLQLFLRYRGDVDAWSRMEKGMTENEWRAIEKLVDDAFLVHEKVASPEFGQQHRERLLLACDSHTTAAEVERVAI